MAADKTQFRLEALAATDKVRGLKSGHADFQPLTTFFEQDAKRFEKCSLARTYVAREGAEPRIVAYLTLVCGEIKAKDGGALAPDGNPYRYDGYPAVKIARLLVDARKRGAGLGRSIINFAVGTAKTVICPSVGCRFVVVDAKQASIAFYEKMGFTILDTAVNRALPSPVMFLDLHRAS